MTNLLANRLWPACTSSLQLDRLLLGELGAEDAAALRVHLDGCTRCSTALTALRADREAARLPPLRVVPFPIPIPEAQRPAGIARPRWHRAAAALAGLAAAAALLLVLRPARVDERIKGAGLGLTMFVQHAGEVRRAGPGEAVAPGDAVRFAVTSPGQAFVAVLSLDPKGRGSIYFPLGGRAEAVAAGVEVPLPLGTRLDATTGEERLLGLFCAAPVELEPLRAGLERGSASVPDGCQVIQWSFVKR